MGEQIQQSFLQKPHIRTIFALICCILWGSAFPCIKIGYEWLDIETTGSQILFGGYRFLMAGIMTFIMGCIIEKRIMTIKKKNMPHIIGLGFLQTTIEYVFFYIGMSNITGSKGAIINGSSTFVAILLAHFLIKGDRMTWRKTAGCLMGFAGVVLINLEGLGGSFSLMGEGMILISTIAYGASSTIVKLLFDKGTPMAITAYQLTFGSIFMIIIGFALGGSVTGFELKSIILLVYMAAISSVGFSLWTVLLKYNPVGKVTIFGFSIPVFGTLLSGIFLGESIFTLQNLAALAFVCAGIIIVNRQEK